MIKKNKRSADAGAAEVVTKKQKTDHKKKTTDPNIDKKADVKPKKKVSFSKKISNSSPRREQNDDNRNPKSKGKFERKKFNPADKSNFKTKGKPFNKANTTNERGKPEADTAPPNWTEFKQQKKELALKRKQSKGSYDVIVSAKKIGEEIRRKTLQGGEEARTKLIVKLHNQLKGKENYAKFVLTHDVGRVVQYLLKYGSADIKEEITKELIPVTVQMLESKYGKFCVKRMLKYSSAAIRSQIIQAMYGHAVKLTSHAISAAVFEYAISLWATPKERLHLTQEFFGDMFKRFKDDKIKHMRDVYTNSPAIKNATLGSVKANLSRIMQKTLYDSMLVQTILRQYLGECSMEERTSMITEIAPHSVVLSNSKDGARAVMMCMWHGTNKDRKVIVKAVREHIVDMCKHEHGHKCIIALIDCMDDTVLLQKSVVNEILDNATNLVQNEWGRKVLMWIVAPANSAHFHPQLIKELETGREASTSKKAPETRRQEVLQSSIAKLLNAITADAPVWLSSAKIAIATLSVLKKGVGNAIKECLSAICKVIVKPDWMFAEDDENSTHGIQHAGFHMALKKLAQHDGIYKTQGVATFGETLLEHLTDETLDIWITSNRGCFLLVAVFENNDDTLKSALKKKMMSYKVSLREQATTGAKILLKKFKE